MALQIREERLRHEAEQRVRLQDEQRVRLATERVEEETVMRVQREMGSQIELESRRSAIACAALRRLLQLAGLSATGWGLPGAGLASSGVAPLQTGHDVRPLEASIEWIQESGAPPYLWKSHRSCAPYTLQCALLLYRTASELSAHLASLGDRGAARRMGRSAARREFAHGAPCGTREPRIAGRGRGSLVRGV